MSPYYAERREPLRRLKNCSLDSRLIYSNFIPRRRLHTLSSSVSKTLRFQKLHCYPRELTSFRAVFFKRIVGISAVDEGGDNRGIKLLDQTSRFLFNVSFRGNKYDSILFLCIHFF